MAETNELFDNLLLEIEEDFYLESVDENKPILKKGETLAERIISVRKLREILTKINPNCNADSEINDLMRKNILSVLTPDEKNLLDEENKSKLQSMIGDIWHKNKFGNDTDRLNHAKVARLLIAEKLFITIGHMKYDIFYYDGAMFRPEGSKVIGQRLQELSEGKLRINDINEIVAHVQRLTFQDNNYFNNDNLNLICVGNGVLNLQTMQLLSNSPEFKFTHQIKWHYNRQADCPKIKKFLHDVLSDDDILVFQEFAGYCLYRRYRYKKAMIFVGNKDTGKTTTINILANFLGIENTSGVSLHKITYDKFAASRMKDKLLNFYDDLSFKDINDTGAFKIATGGGFISAEKKFGDSFEFLNFAKLLFATNKIATVKDNDDLAYFDRWLILFFDSPIENIDTTIIERLITRAEMEGFLVWAIEGLQRLLLNNMFSYTPTAEENKITMERNSNSLSAFVADCLVQVQDVVISKEDMYNAYVGYCQYEKRGAITKDSFGKNLLKKAHYIIDGRKDIEGQRNIRVWRNVGFATRTTAFIKTIFNKKIIINNNFIFIEYASKKGGIAGSITRKDNQQPLEVVE